MTITANVEDVEPYEAPRDDDTQALKLHRKVRHHRNHSHQRDDYT